MKTKSIKGKSPVEIKFALQESEADGLGTTLAAVFLSVRQYRNAVCKVLNDSDISIFGATTTLHTYPKFVKILHLLMQLLFLCSCKEKKVMLLCVLV